MGSRTRSVSACRSLPCPGVSGGHRSGPDESVEVAAVAKLCGSPPSLVHPLTNPPLSIHPRRAVCQGFPGLFLQERCEDAKAGSACGVGGWQSLLSPRGREVGGVEEVLSTEY